MYRFVKILLLVIPFSFLMGTWWSLRRVEHRLKGHHRNGIELRLLYRKGSLPPQILSDFATASGLQISGHAVDSDLALWDEINERPANYDLIQLFSYMAKDMLDTQVFAKIQPELVNHFSRVSPEWKHLPFDSELHFLFPIAWGINGFLWNKKIAGNPPSKLRDVFANPHLKGKIFLLAQESELFDLLFTYGSATTDWFDQEKWEELAQATQSFFQMAHVSTQPIEGLWASEHITAMQVPNGPAANLLSHLDPQEAVYWLPEEKANLWISLIGISKSSSYINEAHEFLSYLQEDAAIQTMVSFDGQATPMTPSKGVTIKPMQQANYVREVDLTKIRWFTNTSSLTPVWYRNLSRVLPDIFDFDSRGSGTLNPHPAPSEPKNAIEESK